MVLENNFISFFAGNWELENVELVLEVKFPKNKFADLAYFYIQRGQNRGLLHVRSEFWCWLW